MGQGAAMIDEKRKAQGERKEKKDLKKKRPTLYEIQGIPKTVLGSTSRLLRTNDGLHGREYRS